MNKVLETIGGWLSHLPVFTIPSVLEVIIIAVIVYQLLNWIMKSRAFTLLKGILVILAFTFISYIFQLNTILWIIERLSTIAVITLVVIFQPELRKALEQLGSNSFLNSLGIGILPVDSEGDSLTKEAASSISKAVFSMAKVKTGALIVIEQSESLHDYVETGIPINGDISSGLLINIFEKNTPLHDGAVIIKGDKVVAATCYLPLSESMNISKDLGTRHRAALGISEVTDSITIVVSEETGGVSYVHRGALTHISAEEQLDRMLFKRINRQKVKFFSILRRNQETNGQN